MKRKTSLFLAAMITAAGLRPAAAAEQCRTIMDVGALAEAAISADPSIAAAACATLRAEGERGLGALLEAHRETVVAMRERRVPLTSEKAERVRSAVDAVAQQRDAFMSGLFWYTDFEEAKAAARSSGKPILSLRLLGKLNEEFSCANSRFFRTTLYANRDINQLLRDHFILHWKSVRPVPRLTIDFGDGRVLERTITGNSVHYLLDADGMVIDALPGLLSAGEFLAILNDRLGLARPATEFSTTPQRAELYAMMHRDQLERLKKQWASDLAQHGLKGPPLNTVRVGAGSETGITPENWTRIGALHSKNARLDPSSRALFLAKNPTAEDAGRRAISKTLVESPLLRAMRKLERSIAEDTMRNEYLFHSQIHQWLAEPGTHDLEALNRRVYAELFLTPDTDPWLGLNPEQTLTALEGEELRAAKVR